MLEQTHKENKQSGGLPQPGAAKDFFFLLFFLNYGTISTSFHFKMENCSFFIKNVRSIKYRSAAGPSGEQ